MSDQEDLIQVLLDVRQADTQLQTMHISLAQSTVFSEIFDFIKEYFQVTGNISKWTCYSKSLNQYITNHNQAIGDVHQKDTFEINTMPIEVMAENLYNDILKIEEEFKKSNFDVQLISQKIQSIQKSFEESIAKYQKNIEEAIQFHNSQFKNLEVIKQQLKSQQLLEKNLDWLFSQEDELKKIELINRVNFLSIQNGLLNFEDRTTQFQQSINMEFKKIPSYDCRIDLTFPQQIIYNGIDLCTITRQQEDQNNQLIEFFSNQDSPLDLRICVKDELNENEYLPIRVSKTATLEDLLKDLSQKYPKFLEEINQDWTVFSTKSQIYLEDRSSALQTWELERDDILIIDRKIINLNLEILDNENKLIVLQQKFQRSLSIKQLQDTILEMINLDKNLFGLDLFYFGQTISSSESKETNTLQNITQYNKTSVQGKVVSLTSNENQK